MFNLIKKNMENVNKVLEVRSWLKNSDFIFKLIDITFVLSKISLEDFIFFSKKLNEVNDIIVYNNYNEKDLVNTATKNNEVNLKKFDEVFDNCEDSERFCSIFKTLVSEEDFENYSNIISNNLDESEMILKAEIQVTKEHNSNLS